MKKLAVLNVVGLTPSLLGESTPNLSALAKAQFTTPMAGVVPAVTTTAQSTMLTGKPVSEHGIVGNGWYFRDLAEVGFWKQNNALVGAPKIWDVLKQKNPGFKVSKLFWWYNMYANVDASITPRPHYLADGGKIFDLYSSPQGLHANIESKIGKFPFFNFWGPKAGIESSEWIAAAAIEEFKLNEPDLQLVYLPHLDYNFQRLGPNHEGCIDDVKAIDRVCGDLIKFYQSRDVEIMVVSEYGITEVDQPVHLNRVLRNAGYINVRETAGDKWPNGFETLDCGASKAFAVSDHQCAHVYVQSSDDIADVKRLLLDTPGVEQVLDAEEQKTLGVNHARTGELFVIAEPRAWFTYYYWLNDAKAPDFARTVDIHRKPGYDPVEMFIDPSISFPMLKLAGKLAKKKLGLRTLMDVIPLNAELVKGSHGRPVEDPELGPILIAPSSLSSAMSHQSSTSQLDIFDLLLDYYAS